MTKGKLYLIPTLLGETAVEKVLPLHNLRIITQLADFIVEEERTARRFLKKVNKEIDIATLKFYLLNEHTKEGEISEYLEAALAGRDIGLLSEAGMPCVADPGALIVRMAHEKGITVIPLSGPSSVLMALSASGFNGQNFCFHGYLPVDKAARIKKIREIEQLIYSRDQTQIFIETPYRNMPVYEALLQHCRPGTSLCIASDITGDKEMIKTKVIAQWKKENILLGKVPAVFLLYK